MTSFHVERELYVAAPEGDAIYSQGPTYTRRDGRTIVETIRHEALHFMPDGKRLNYSKRIYCRQSDDNGRTWRVYEDLFRGSPEQLAGVHKIPGGSIRFPDSDVLVMFELSYELNPDEPMFSIGNTISRTYRTLYRLSRDGGATWTRWRQVIDGRPEYDADHSASGLCHGHTTAVCDGQPVFMPDGSMLTGFSIWHSSPPPEDVSERAKESYISVIDVCPGAVERRGHRVGVAVRRRNTSAIPGCLRRLLRAGDSETEPGPDHDHDAMPGRRGREYLLVAADGHLR